MAKETIPSLHNAFLGRPLDTGIWENDAFIGGRVRTEGEPACASANWCTTACAVALYAGRDYARPWWMQYFEQAAHRFMGKEPFSRIYAHWMAYPVMYVAWHASKRGDAELQSRATSWLRAFWTYLCIAGVDHDQRNQFINDRTFPAVATSFAGARSFERGDDAHGNKHRGAPYHIDAWITGTTLKRALFGTPFPSGWFEDAFEELQAMERAGFNWSGLSAEEKETLIRILRGQIGAAEIAAIRDWAGPYRTLPTYRLIRSREGVTLYVEKLTGTGTSGETAPVYGCYTALDGSQQFLAPDNGYRPAGEARQFAISFGSTEVRDGRVYAKRGDGRVFAENTESLKHSIPLPAGEPILDLRFGPEGMQVLVPGGASRPRPEPQPIVDPPPAPSPQPTPAPKPRPPVPTKPGAWIGRAEFERYVGDKYFRHLPPGSDAHEVFQHLFQTVFLLMGATDPHSAEICLDAETRRKIGETLANVQEKLRSFGDG